MPSTSAKQHRFMAAIAHNPSFAKKVGVSQSVGKDFNAADKGKTFNKGGMMKTRKFAEAGYVDDSDMDDEGNTRSKYEIDPDSRRAHGLYDKKPVVKKTKRTFRKEPFRGGQQGYDEAGRFLGGQRGFNEAGTANKSGTKQTQFAKGGMMKESKAMVGKEMAFMKKKGAPKSMIKHEKAEMMGMKKGGMPMKDGKPMFMQKKMMGGGMAKYAKGGSIRRMADGGMTAPMAPPMAPQQPPVDPRQMAAMQAAMQAQGGAAPMAPGMKRGGSVRFAKGGGIESRGKTKGTIIRMASGGSVSSASRRADGIAQRGKTRC
jgi:hypothetical protein